MTKHTSRFPIVPATEQNALTIERIKMANIAGRMNAFI